MTVLKIGDIVRVKTSGNVYRLTEKFPNYSGKMTLWGAESMTTGLPNSFLSKEIERV